MATHSITVTVDSARNLRAADVGGTSDPFAEVYIGDHRGKPRNRPQKTSTIKHTLNPRWNETFTFHVTNAEISSSSLVVKLMDWDRFTRNDKLGYFVTSLSRVMANPYQDNWFPLTKSLKNNMPDQGSVHLIISVDGKGPGQQTGTGISGIPAGSAAPYQPQYSTQPPYMGGGQPPMQQQAPLPQHSGKYPGLGTTGSSFVAPSPAQPYPPPAGMPGYPPQQPPMQQQAPLQQQQAYGSQPMPGGGYPGMGGYAPGMGGGYPGQRPPGGTGYPPQAPYGAQPPYGQPPVGPPPQQGGLGLPAAYIPSFRPQQL